MKMERTVILIRESAREAWRRDASLLAFLVCAIGIGVMLDSAAMQWVGAAVFFVGLLNRAAGAARNCQMTPQDAADLLRQKYGAIGKDDAA